MPARPIPPLLGLSVAVSPGKEAIVTGLDQEVPEGMLRLLVSIDSLYVPPLKYNVFPADKQDIPEAIVLLGKFGSWAVAHDLASSPVTDT
jgi:hypothetical protein